MSQGRNTRPTAPSGTGIPVFRPRTSIRSKVLRQSVLLVAFCVLLLGGFAFFIITKLLADIQISTGDAFYNLRVIGFTVLVISGLLLVLALLLGTLLSRSLTGPLQDLAAKVKALKTGSWAFTRTVYTGDEVETLDRVVDDLTGRLRDTYQHLEEKVAERTKELQKASALDRAILESIEYGVLAIDTTGIITDANPAACTLLQTTQDQLIGVSAEQALTLQQRKRKAFSGAHPIAQVLHTHRSYRSHPSLHVSLLRKDGIALPITLLVVPLLKGKTCFGAIAVIQDQSLERQIDYMKSEFISLASHQLRTPLSSMRWYIEMLTNEEGSFSEEHKSYIQEIDVASKRMANLINALLHVAQLEDGGLVAEKQIVDLQSFVERLTESWHVSAKEQGIELVVMMPKIRTLTLQSDPVLLEIVLQNLFANALKYSPGKKPITLAITSDATHIRCTVSDQGLGIPAVDIPRIFQKFFRAKNVREVDTDGTGLGLYMSKTIVENLGGTLTFETKEGKGSSFTVMLPL